MSDSAIAVFPEINYRDHPAYAHLAVAAPSAQIEADVQGHAAAVDAGYAALACALPPHVADFAHQFTRQVRAPLDALAEHAEQLSADPRMRQWLGDAARVSANQLRQQLDLARRRGGAQRAHQPTAPAGAAALEACGFARFALDPVARASLLDAAQPWCRTLRSRAAKTPARRLHQALPVASGFLQRLLALARDSGALAAAQHYAGVPLVFEHAALHYSHPAQRWSSDCYADAGVAAPRLRYLHYDFNTVGVKMLIYLHPVAAGQGEFAYVGGSHRWQRSECRHALRNQLDTAFVGAFGRAPDEAYYRPRFKHPEHRRAMLSAPSLFHGCSHFGDDLIEGDALTRRLEDSEQQIVEPDAFVVFDGGRGLHRGGVTEQTERFAVQLGFVPRPELGLGATIKQQLRRWWHRRPSQAWNGAERP